MSQTDNVVERYIAIWNETDGGRRRDLIAQTWDDDSSYVDPLFSADGHEGIDALVAGFQQQFPEHRFRLSSEIDQHHDRVRFSWELMEPIDGLAIVKGTDFGLVAEDGRLQRITGFLDQIPAELLAR
ncbi:MAG: nuclear transport factor 2 family protein [Nitrolancea sp.]